MRQARIKITKILAHASVGVHKRREGDLFDRMCHSNACFHVMMEGER